jgi:hypothetical protein
MISPLTELWHFQKTEFYHLKPNLISVKISATQWIAFTDK